MIMMMILTMTTLITMEKMNSLVLVESFFVP